jgi:hypothetical protein
MPFRSACSRREDLSRSVGGEGLRPRLTTPRGPRQVVTDDLECCRWPDGVSGAAAERGGDVVGTGEAVGAGGEVAQAGHNVGRVAGATCEASLA